MHAEKSDILRRIAEPNELEITPITEAHSTTTEAKEEEEIDRKPALYFQPTAPDP
jgi:hypothetical protein